MCCINWACYQWEQVPKKGELRDKGPTLLMTLDVSILGHVTTYSWEEHYGTEVCVGEGPLLHAGQEADSEEETEDQA